MLELKEAKVCHCNHAVDCGIVVNPDVVRAQVQGGIIFGITAALCGEPQGRVCSKPITIPIRCCV